MTFTAVYSQVRVKGYYKKDGTYVQSHVRSNPDGYVYNNWSTKGNINPYTGKEGTKNGYTGTGSQGYNAYYSTYSSSNSTDTREVVATSVTEVPQGSLNRSSNVRSHEIEMTYFEKKGSAFKESFSLKNNSDRNIRSVSIRIIYKLENGTIIDYRDFILSANIPSGLAKKFDIESFDQNQKFSYKYGNDYAKDYYTLFTVEYVILNYN